MRTRLIGAIVAALVILALAPKAGRWPDAAAHG